MTLFTNAMGSCHRHQLSFNTYLFLRGLCLALGGDHGAEMVVEQVVKLLGESVKFGAVGVLDAGGTDDSLEELSLENDLAAGMDIIGFDAETLVELLKVLFFFLVAFA